MLHATDLWFAFGQQAVVREVTLAIPRGAIVGILGPNGSGKTTLLRLLSGALHPRTGRVELEGADLSTLTRAAVARRIAVVPQETQLAFDYTVLEIALMGRYPHLGPFELEGPADVDLARDALRTTATLDLAHRTFATLSGGEKQRVIIASALAQLSPAGGRGRRIRQPHDAAPQLLLLDEPTASLDMHYQIEVAALLRRLNAERGLTIVVSTHDLNFAASVCRELLLLREGRVLLSGPTARVLTPEAVRALYGVDADVTFNQAAGHLTVVPMALAEA